VPNRHERLVEHAARALHHLDRMRRGKTQTRRRTIGARMGGLAMATVI